MVVKENERKTMLLEMSLQEKKKLCEKLKTQLNRPPGEPASTVLSKFKQGNFGKPNAGLPLSQLSSEDKDFDDDLNAFIGVGDCPKQILLGGKPNKKRKLN